jgi:hypothetical protein
MKQIYRYGSGWFRIGIALALVAGLGCFGSQRYDWEERYRRDYRQPYDLYALHELLQSGPAGREVIPVDDSLQLFLPDTGRAATYFFVGDMVYLEEPEWSALYRWVSRGNTAFLSCRGLPEYLDRNLRMYAGCYTVDSWLSQYTSADTATLSLDWPATTVDGAIATLVHRNRSGPAPTYWSYLDVPYYCELERAETLGYLNGEGRNFLRFAHGDGYFYLHLAPQAFTNYQLRDSAVFDYANQCLQVLGEGPVYWDEFNKSPYEPYEPPGEEQQQRLLRSNHALRYLLSEPPLAAAWYLLVALAILFVLFRSKRRQAIIPVRPARQNTSFAYLSDIGELYYQSSNHRQLAEEQRKLFEKHLRDRYGLSYRNEESFCADLVARTGISAGQAARIQQEIRHLDTTSGVFGAEDLLRFYRALEEVYLGD